MSIKYDSYIFEHIANVQHGLQWMRDNIYDVADFETWARAINNADKHDNSKWSNEEYDAYDNYFYGNRSSSVVREFDRAWLHHIHCNPHHWQYWILFEDDPMTGHPYKVLPIPKEYILEMVADWWSFSWKTEKLDEIFTWYDAHKKTILMNAESRVYLNKVLDALKKALEEKEMISHDIDETSSKEELQHSDAEKDNDIYGIPELKKYPMPDKKHVVSAIRFFNYVDAKYEKELADAILDKIKEYDMSFDEFGVGDENRFKNYIPKEEKDS